MCELEKILKERGVRSTAIRLLVLKAMLEFKYAFSLSDLEDKLITVDKSTLFRTITLFHKKLLIHSIDDGSGSVKYSVCGPKCLCDIGDLHLHFHCTKCNKTFCLESISVPEIRLPDNFQLESVNFVLKGYCDDCSKIAT
ncbi:Fur family ferric uptake transcriptional regulator [Dysgonomonadaceae bacterium PH5-43]|nr:Fur family ferric uptake transcriptional regulator [Dysgonomonadaceae bacterium PH5-43]